MHEANFENFVRFLLGESGARGAVVSAGDS
jgi:hypothetical protein